MTEGMIGRDMDGATIREGEETTVAMDLEVATEVRPKMIDPGAAPSPKSPIDPTCAMKEKDQNFNSKLAVNLLKTANQLLQPNLQAAIPLARRERSIPLPKRKKLSRSSNR